MIGSLAIRTRRLYVAHPCGFSTAQHGLALQRSELMGVLQKFNTDIREQADGRIELKECKLCNKKNRLKADNIWKLSVWQETGSFNCMRCSKGGSWRDLQRAVGMVGKPHSSGAMGNSPYLRSLLSGQSPMKKQALSSAATTAAAATEKVSDASVGKEYLLPSQILVASYHCNLFPPTPHDLSCRDADACEGAQSPHRVLMKTSSGGSHALLRSASTEIKAAERRAAVLRYLNEERGLHDAVLQRYLVGVSVQQFLDNDSSEWKDQVCVTFPWTMPSEQLLLTPAAGADADADAGAVARGGVGSGQQMRKARFSNRDDARVPAPVASSADARLHYIVRAKFR